jgi:hypothetical protein
MNPASGNPGEFSLETCRSNLLKGYNFIITDHSLESCLSAVGATISSSLVANCKNFNLGHFNKACPTISLSELVSVITLADLTFLGRLENEYARQQESAPKATVKKPFDVRPVIKATTLVEGNAEMVVEFTDLMRPAKIDPQLSDTSTTATVNFKNFRKTPGIKRNLSCIGIADMVAYKSIMETGVNNEKQEPWLQDAAPTPKSKSLSDGFGEVAQAKKVKKEAIQYQPIAVDLTDENTNVNAKKENEDKKKNETGFRSSFFSSIV